MSEVFAVVVVPVKLVLLDLELVEAAGSNLEVELQQEDLD